MADEAQKAVSRIKKKPKPTGEPRRRRRNAPADPTARPAGFPMPFALQPEEETPDVAGD